MVRWRGKLITLGAWSVTIIGRESDSTDDTVLFRSGEVSRRPTLGQPLGAQLDPGARIAMVVNASALGMTWLAEPATVEGARKIDSDVTVLTSQTPPDMLDITASDYAYYETSVQLPESEKDDWWLRVFLPPSSGVTVFFDGVAAGVQNNGEQALFTETALAVPLPHSNKSTTRSIVLLAASFGTNGAAG
mgnify:CR=1 FL=1